MHAHSYQRPATYFARRGGVRWPPLPAEASKLSRKRFREAAIDRYNITPQHYRDPHPAPNHIPGIATTELDPRAVVPPSGELQSL